MYPTLLPKLALLAAALFGGLFGNQGGRICVKVDGSVHATAVAMTPCCDDEESACAGEGLASDVVAQPKPGCTQCLSCSSLPQTLVLSRAAASAPDEIPSLYDAPVIP